MRHSESEKDLNDRLGALRDPATLRHRLTLDPWFAGLPEPLADWLLSAARLQLLVPGELLFARGDIPDGLYAVVEGVMRIGANTEDGREALLALFEPVGWFGEIALFDGLPRTHDARADSVAILFHVPGRALARFLEEQPQYWQDFGLLVTRKLRLALAVLEETALLPAPARLARRLVLMAEGYGALRDTTRRVLTVPQDQLAAMLALSRQTTNQILKDFEARGAVRLRYGGIELLDLALLRAFGNETAGVRGTPRARSGS